MGILIAVDGVDASGKQTQTELLKKKLERNYSVRLVSFPMYDNPSSTAVRMYLNGELGKKAGDVNAYAASSFFAADRYITYKTDWGNDYNAGKIILADRYVSSNMIHQAGKITDARQREEFLDWAHDFEYVKLGLPQPNLTIFLDMPPKFGAKLMQNRANKINGSTTMDIHESDASYLAKSYENAMSVAKKYGWCCVSCVKDGRIRGVEEINEEMLKIAERVIGAASVK